MYVDGIKFFAENEKELKTLIHSESIYSHDWGVEFGIEKYAMLIMKRVKRQMTEGAELPNQEKLERSEKKKLTNTWEDTGSGYHQTSGDEKKKIKKNISWKREEYSKSIYVEISSKGWKPVLSLS